MFAEFLNIIFKSLKLDKNLYKNNKNFVEAAIYFAGLIMILDGVAGAVAANTLVKTSIGIFYKNGAYSQCSIRNSYVSCAFRFWRSNLLKDKLNLRALI